MITDTIKYLDHPVAIAYDINPKDKHDSFLLVVVTLRTQNNQAFCRRSVSRLAANIADLKDSVFNLIGIYISFI